MRFLQMMRAQGGPEAVAILMAGPGADVAGGNHDDSAMLMFDVAGGHGVRGKLLLDHGADVAGASRDVFHCADVCSS